MKKVLIYFPENKLEPKGGPSGYLYELKNGMQCLKDDSIKISFLPAVPNRIEDNKVIRDKVPSFFREYRRIIRYSNLHNKKNNNEIIKNYDLIHFHYTEDLYFNREVLRDYSGKVVLTSHTPCAPFVEKLNRLTERDQRRYPQVTESLKAIDEYSFNRADYVIFPCPEAEEPYYHTWSEYKDIRSAEKYKYLLTGIAQCSANESKEHIRKTYGIPANAFVVCYVGRHNKIKGYETLKEIAKEVIDENTYFLIAGNETPLKRLNDPHWIEVGWTNDPHSIINAADVFILPNEETYFDLIMLEVLSLGVPIIASYTGGNKYFMHYNSESICLFKSKREAISIINMFKSNSPEYLKKLGSINKSIFADDFTNLVFAKKYVNIIKEILNE